MNTEPLVMLSALEHFSYCPRQCGLIHNEAVWDENLFTLKGSQEHERADSEATTWEGGVRVVRGLPLFHDGLGLVGKADVVEFHPDGRVTPVEYKHGGRRPSRHDDLQLCGQALCLESMLGVVIASGAIFSLATRKRRTVLFDDELRDATVETIHAVRALLTDTGPLPDALNDNRCPHCSLLDACVPATVVDARARWHASNLYRLDLNTSTSEDTP